MPRPFGGVKEQAAGWFQAYYPGVDCKRVHEPTHFPSKDSARAWLDDVARERSRGSWLDPAMGHQRFDEFAVEWLRTARVASTTRELYAGYLDNHLTPFFGLMELAQIDPPKVRAWYAAMEAKGVPTARARSYSLLRQILNVAVSDGAITANPCRIKDAGTTRHKTKATPDLLQARRIAARMPKRWRFLCVLAVFSTARFGELVALRRRDLSVLKMTMTVDRQWYRGAFRETKREASEHTVHLPTTIRGLMENHLALFVGPEPDALVFPTRNGTPPPNNWIDTLVKRAAADIGMEGVTFHSFRHAGGTLYAQAGATTRELMRRMGQTTSRAAMTYQHAADDRDAALAEAVGRGATSGAKVLPLKPREGGRVDRSARG